MHSLAIYLGYTTNARSQSVQTAKSFRCITIVIGCHALFRNTFLHEVMWFYCSNVLLMARLSSMMLRKMVARLRWQCYCWICEVGFPMVRKCFGGWNFSEYTIFVLTFCWWKEKTVIFWTLLFLLINMNLLTGLQMCDISQQRFQKGCQLSVKKKFLESLVFHKILFNCSLRIF